MVNILISVNSNYLDKAETMLHSFRRHNVDEITVYLINHTLNSYEINRFRKYLKRNLNMHLEVIAVSNTIFDSFPLGSERFTLEIYYRVLAQFLLPQNVDRIIWLDADIVICGNIKEFYNQSFDGNLLVACPDVAWKSEAISQIKENLGLNKEHIYFNSGVLLLNIEAMRRETNYHDIVQSAYRISDYLVFPDQDLLNYLYSERVKYCDQNKYNCHPSEFNKLTCDQHNYVVILHYAGFQKPWSFNYNKELSKAVRPYWKEVFLQGRWLSIIKVTVLYFLWLVYDSTGICKIVRKIGRKQ